MGALPPRSRRELHALDRTEELLIDKASLLGLSAPVPDLIESLRSAAPFSKIKGFAVGRTIFHDVAKQWLVGEVSDEQAIETMAERLSALVEAWRAARAGIEEAA